MEQIVSCVMNEADDEKPHFKIMSTIHGYYEIKNQNIAHKLK